MKPNPTNVIEFWVVWNPEAKSPTVRHVTEQSAINAAKKLADKNPGHSFYVLKSTSVARGVEERKTTVTVETTRPTVKDLTWEERYPRMRYRVPDYAFRATCRPEVTGGVKVRVWYNDGSTFVLSPDRVFWGNAIYWHYVNPVNY